MARMRLIEAARVAAQNAYCPYSHLPAGAAVLTLGGNVYEGCKVENREPGLIMCAERVAIFTAVANGDPPIGIAVSHADRGTGEPKNLMPCDACRRVMAEIMGADAIVWVDEVGQFTVGQLM